MKSTSDADRRAAEPTDVVQELRDVGLVEYRKIVERPCRLVFRDADRRVVTLGILDSRRDLEELLIQRAIEG